jgi:parallel beta-helix repeat protein
VLNNIIHDCNLAGVGFNNKEWYYVIHNTVYNNAWTSGYQGSGIGLVVVQCIEKGVAQCASGNTYAGGTGTYTPSGMDLVYGKPFHIIVSGNVVYNNKIAANNPVGCGNHTDGNGIIMDTFFDETTLSIVYPYQSLVAGNVSFTNGARGVHVFRTSNVTVANNTVYGNGTDNCINGYYTGDLSMQGGSNNVWVNNVSQAVMSTNNAACGQYCGGRNSPLVAGDGAGVTSSNNTYSHNVLFGGLGVQLFDADVNYFSCSSNKCATDPQLINPTKTNFAIQLTSPAVGYGLPGYYLTGSPVDTGACSNVLATCQ